MEHHAEASIEFLTTELGGRSGALRDGYRAQFEYNNEVWDSVLVYPDNGGLANPGETVRTLIWFTRLEFHRSQVTPGMPFEIREGPTLIGRGIVVSTHFPDDQG